MIEYNQIILSLFLGMAGVIGGQLIATLKKATNSIEELNLKIAVVLGELKNHEHRITSLEKHK